jgi:hypothetical protein
MRRPGSRGNGGPEVRLERRLRRVVVLLGGIVAGGSAGTLVMTRAAEAPASQPTTIAATTAPAARLAVPSSAAQRAARLEIERSLGKRLATVKTAPERADLAAELLRAASDAPDATLRYVLLNTARDLAADAGGVEQATGAQAQLEASYRVDGLRTSLNLYRRLFRCMPPDDRALLCGPMVASIDWAVRDDRYDLAKQMGALAATCARESPTGDLGDRVAASSAHAAACEAAYARVSRLETTLKTHPADRPANLAVGKFQCFVKENWARGLPLLARSDDAKLAGLASDELAVPQSATAQAALADGWWDYAESQAAAQRPAIRLHAGDWYGRAAPGLRGLDRLKAEQRAGPDRTPAPPVAPLGPGEAPPGATLPPPILAPAPTPPQAANPTPPPVFTSPLQVLQTLPPDLYPRTAADVKDEDRRKAINRALKDRAADKQATFAVVVSRIDDRNPDSALLNVKPMRLGPFTVEAAMAFDRRFKDQIPAIKVGATYAVTGNIGGVGFYASSLFFNLNTCHLVGPNAPPHSDEKVAAHDAARRRLADTAGAARDEYTSLDQILGLVPANLYPRRAADWTPDRILTLNDMLRSRVSWKKGTFDVVARLVDLTQPARPVLNCTMQVGNTPVELILFFNIDPEPAVFGAKPGRLYTVTGKIAGAQFMGQKLHITMNTCHMVAKK